MWTQEIKHASAPREGNAEPRSRKAPRKRIPTVQCCRPLLSATHTLRLSLITGFRLDSPPHSVLMHSTPPPEAATIPYPSRTHGGPALPRDASAGALAPAGSVGADALRTPPPLFCAEPDVEGDGAEAPAAVVDSEAAVVADEGRGAGL